MTSELRVDLKKNHQKNYIQLMILVGKDLWEVGRRQNPLLFRKKKGPCGSCERLETGLIIKKTVLSKLQAFRNGADFSKNDIFGTNGVHTGDTDALITGFCTEFRSGSNGTTPGPPNPLKTYKKGAG